MSEINDAALGQSEGQNRIPTGYYVLLATLGLTDAEIWAANAVHSANEGRPATAVAEGVIAVGALVTGAAGAVVAAVRLRRGEADDSPASAE